MIDAEIEQSEAPETRPETRNERLAFHAYATVAWLGRVLPTHTGRMLFRWGGTAAYHLAPKVRSVVLANQGQVLGRPPNDPSVIASGKDAFRRYARYWFDAFDVVDWPSERLLERFRFVGLEHMESALAAGNGAIAVLPHMGNWDAAGRAMHAAGLPIVSVAERLRPERLFRLFVAHREALGMQIIGLDHGGVGRQLTRLLKENRIVALVADRDLTGRGIEVEMFGRRRRVPAGPALLSLSSGAPIIVCDLYHEPRGWRCVMHQPLDVQTTGNRRTDVTAISQAMANAFERAISALPADWHLFQAGWPDGRED
jgi:phosphatidylinositol dimannoside acyltransferase